MKTRVRPLALQLFAEGQEGGQGTQEAQTGSQGGAASQPAQGGTPAAGQARGGAQAGSQRAQAGNQGAHGAGQGAQAGSQAQQGTSAASQGADRREAQLEPILRQLAGRYGLEPGEQGYDLEALGQALEADKPRDWGEIHSQAEAARAVYPSLDLMRELGNPEFSRLVAAGAPVRAAYEVVHRDEILGGAMAYAVQETTRKLSGAVMSGSTRPQESGMGGGSAALHRMDPASLTKAERKSLRDRVMRGEKVVL